MSTNHTAPVGISLDGWRQPDAPAKQFLHGSWCRLEPLNAEQHAEQLFAANAQDTENRIWTYLPYGPYQDLESYKSWVTASAAETDPQFFAIIDLEKDAATGVASYLRITPASGSIEVGHINYSPLLQQTVAATEAMYLMMKQAFDMGYRRYEWKCDALNEPSRRAAARLGFTYEGTFRQATVYKMRNRDTAWFSIIDSEWPALNAVYLSWLNRDNFDSEGRQQQSLSLLTQSALAQGG